MSIDSSGSAAYWEDRARRFAIRGRGLAAVCSYGMPAFHNLAIDLTQRRALWPWLHPAPGSTVLDVGCGIGRWSLRLAERGAVVTGIDLSPTMVEQARHRACAQGLDRQTWFQVGDLAELDLGRRFDHILGVTVLQHVLDPIRLGAAVSAIASHLAPGGRAILLEASPSLASTRCDSAVFQARTQEDYLEVFADAGLRCERIGGVDPSPLRTWLLPSYRRLPRSVALVSLGLLTAVSLPIDLVLGTTWVAASWHKVFVLRAEGDAP